MYLTNILKHSYIFNISKNCTILAKFLGAIAVPVYPFKSVIANLCHPVPRAYTCMDIPVFAKSFVGPFFVYAFFPRLD